MREYPVTKMWYGKGARFNTIEELIAQDPTYLIWMVEKFQDLTKEQASLFKELFGMELPTEVICQEDPGIEIEYQGVTQKVDYPFNPTKFNRKEVSEVYELVCRKYEESLSGKEAT